MLQEFQKTFWNKATGFFGGLYEAAKITFDNDKKYILDQIGYLKNKDIGAASILARESVEATRSKEQKEKLNEK